ncbi:hypothetical protein DH2020_000297 [Rehmannia glutinosa]|uniref:Cyclin-dependent kinases regulatory subunit n=1 Tax=Rehmannia glutinosa TaxID=99300 RepID=A0ABR0XWH5_REHGL
MGQIQYSEKYFDDTYEYRHVVLPPEVAKLLPKNRLLSEISIYGAFFHFFFFVFLVGRMNGVPLVFNRAVGGSTMQSTVREPHIMLFRRPLNYQQQQDNQAQQDILAK